MLLIANVELDNQVVVRAFEFDYPHGIGAMITIVKLIMLVYWLICNSLIFQLLY